MILLHRVIYKLYARMHRSHKTSSANYARRLKNCVIFCKSAEVKVRGPTSPKVETLGAASMFMLGSNILSNSGCL
jgi:hypothetical protein